MRGACVSFRMLGAVAVSTGADELTIPAPRQRALLAQLLLAANQTVSTSKLIDGIWGDTPPQHPEAALHIVVSRLRRALAGAAPRLARDSCGYRIRVDVDELDLTKAQAAFADAQRAMREGDARCAAALLDAGLALWSGDPISDLAAFPFHDAAARELRELQIAIVELRYAAYLRCGRHVEVLDEVARWIRAEPWRESLRAHQMVALYRCGRQVEAIAAYEDLRRLLLSDFGVDPCDELKQLHCRILRQDPELRDDHVDGDARGLDELPPRVVPGMVDEELLVEGLRRIALDPSDVVIVEGGPGVEKAWLVVEVPRRVPGEHDPGARAAMRRVDLSDSLARISSWLPHAEIPLPHALLR